MSRRDKDKEKRENWYRGRSGVCSPVPSRFSLSLSLLDMKREALPMPMPYMISSAQGSLIVKPPAPSALTWREQHRDIPGAVGGATGRGPVPSGARFEESPSSAGQGAG